MPAICATGAESPTFADSIAALTGDLVSGKVTALTGVDFDEIGGLVESAGIDFLVGTSKGYSIARKLGKPLIRAGFPIHDRFGGQRTLHLGYAGALAFYDRIVNTLLEIDQAGSPVGYAYL